MEVRVGGYPQSEQVPSNWAFFPYSMLSRLIRFMAELCKTDAGRSIIVTIDRGEWYWTMLLPLIDDA